MIILFERSNGILIASPKGRVDSRNYDRFHRTLSAKSEDASSLIIDMNGLTYIIRGCLRSLLQIAKVMWGRSGASFILCSTSESPVGRTLHVGGFDQTVDICESVEDAKAQAQAGSELA